MSRGALGREYRDGDIIVRRGETGDCMYVVQDGHVEVIRDDGGRSLVLARLDPGEFFGEMAIFEHEVRSATVRASGPARILTVDRKTLMRRFQEDPSLGLKILETLSRRIRRLDEEVVRLRAALREAGGAGDARTGEADGVAR